MSKIIKTFPLKRICRICKEEIQAVLMYDDDGYYICEVCDCTKYGTHPRLNSYDVSDYMNELQKRIEAEQEIASILAKYTE